jgi:hypothetical protein
MTGLCPAAKQPLQDFSKHLSQHYNLCLNISSGCVCPAAKQPLKTSRNVSYSTTISALAFPVAGESPAAKQPLQDFSIHFLSRKKKKPALAFPVAGVCPAAKQPLQNFSIQFSQHHNLCISFSLWLASAKQQSHP